MKRIIRKRYFPSDDLMAARKDLAAAISHLTFMTPSPERDHVLALVKSSFKRIEPRITRAERNAMYQEFWTNEVRVAVAKRVPLEYNAMREALIQAELDLPKDQKFGGVPSRTSLYKIISRAKKKR